MGTFKEEVEHVEKEIAVIEQQPNKNCVVGIVDYVSEVGRARLDGLFIGRKTTMRELYDYISKDLKELEEIEKLRGKESPSGRILRSYRDKLKIELGIK